MVSPITASATEELDSVGNNSWPRMTRVRSGSSWSRYNFAASTPAMTANRTEGLDRLRQLRIQISQVTYCWIDKAAPFRANLIW